MRNHHENSSFLGTFWGTSLKTALYILVHVVLWNTIVPKKSIIIFVSNQFWWFCMVKKSPVIWQIQNQKPPLSIWRNFALTNKMSFRSTPNFLALTLLNWLFFTGKSRNPGRWWTKKNMDGSPSKVVPLALSWFISTMINWLVVEPPLWKIWVRQLGWWHSQLIWENNKCSKPPIS